MRKCDRCGFEGRDDHFSRHPRYKHDPRELVGHVCKKCVALEERDELKERLKNRKDLREFEREQVRKQKAKLKDGARTAAVLHAAQRSGMLIPAKVLTELRKEAKTFAQKRNADNQLKKLLRERIALLKSVKEEDLPEYLAFKPEELEFLLEQNQKDEKAQELRYRASVDGMLKPVKKLENGNLEVVPLEDIEYVKPTRGKKAEEKDKESKVRLELAARTLARRRLIQFIKRVKPDYDAGWVHYDICRQLERFVEEVEAGLSPRLMLFVPPRHGKSLIASDMFPSWVIGKHPEWEFIAASYNVSLPIEFSRNIRDRMKGEEYQALFPKVNLRQDSQSAERWVTKEGGGYIAAGVGSGITGKGAHILTIDDPIKDAQEADSLTIRETAWNWWSSTASTRLAPNSGVLIIQTRWHDDDLSGRLVTQMKELIKEGVPEEEIERWKIIEYPAIATEDEWLVNGEMVRQAEVPQGGEVLLLRRKGEALHPSRYNLQFLKRKRRNMQPRHWSALYQQNPMPDEGEYFKKDMFRFTSSLPPLHHMKVFAAFDLAIGEKQQNDYTVGVVGGLDYNDQLYVFDLIRFKGDTFKIVEAILAVYAKYKPEIIGIEKGQLELAIMPVLKKRMRETRQYPVLAEGDKALLPITDKLTRARPLQGRMQQGMVYVLNTQPWWETMEAELLRFPGGVHDDIVDAMAWLVRLVTNEEPPKKPADKAEKRSWKDKLNSYTNSGKGKGYMAA